MCGGADTGYDDILCKMIEEETIKESQEKLKDQQKKAIEENRYIITSTQKQKIDLSQI